MGFFGLFNLGLMATAKIVTSIQDSTESERCRKEAIEQGRNWYLDANLKKRNVYNNHQILDYHDKNGDRITEDLVTKQKINHSKIERELRFQEIMQNAKKNGATVVELDEKNASGKWIYVTRDIKTWQIVKFELLKMCYWKRNSCTSRFCNFTIGVYTDENGKILRLSDGVSNRRKMLQGKELETFDILSEELYSYCVKNNTYDCMEYFSCSSEEEIVEAIKQKREDKENE